MSLILLIASSLRISPEGEKDAPMGRILKDIPALVEQLKDQRARTKDLVSPSNRFQFDHEGGQVVMRVIHQGQSAAYPVQRQVDGQLGNKYGIHMKYFRTMQEKGAADLLAQNLEYWRTHKSFQGDKRLLRMIDGQVRAFLSSTYRPIDHLDLLTTAIQVITGQDGAGGKTKPYARGARAFGWDISPTKLRIALVNPSLQIDLKNLKAGVKHVAPEDVVVNGGGGTDFVFGGKTVQSSNPNEGGWFQSPDKKDKHIVFPAAFLSNSETGHGGLNVEIGLYEAICDNTCKIGQDFARRHIGRELEEGDFYSAKTFEKMNAVIFAKVADTIRAAFDPEELLVNAKKMKGLQDITVDDVKEAVSSIVKLDGITEDVRDDILSAYQPLQVGRNTLLDVQRAVTASAHTVREGQPDLADALETVGGSIIDRGLAALKS